MCEECFPPRFWGLDPLFSAKAKLNVSDVLSLNCYPDFPGQHPGKDRVDANMLTMYLYHRYYISIYACTSLSMHTHGSFPLPLLTPRGVLYREPPCSGCACDGRCGVRQEKECPHTV